MMTGITGFFSLVCRKTHMLCSEDVDRSGQRNVSQNTIQAYTIFVLHSPEERASVVVKIMMNAL